MISNITRTFLLFSFSLAIYFFALFTSIASGQSTPSSKARWILVTTKGLVNELEPLVLRRQQHGFEVVKIVRGEQIPSNEWTSEAIQSKIAEQCNAASRPSFVLLVGDWNEANESSFLPPSIGKEGRMQRLPTDYGYGLPSEAGAATISVGRYPARNAEDVRQFVARIARYEDQSIGPWTNRMNLWIGHPGGNSALEKRLGETVVQSAVNKSLSQLDLAWQGDCLIDFPNTPYSVDRKQFREGMMDQLMAGHCFTIYAGHANTQGIWSEDSFVFTRDEWKQAKIQSSPGVVLTTGCYVCQMRNRNDVGFLAASMQNPDGPVACIGSYEESYAAHGQLALDAFVELVSKPAPPTRLGDYWIAISSGLATGKMDPLTFWLYDQADGSRGAVPLDKQRLEHLEMWTLLGDPATKIPYLEPTLKLDLTAEIDSNEVAVEFDVPEALQGAICEIQLQNRPVSSKRKTKPAKSAKPQIDSYQIEKESRFACKVSVSSPLMEGELRVRVFVYKGGHGVLGTTTKSIKQP